MQKGGKVVVQFFAENWPVFLVSAITAFVGFFLKDFYLKIKNIPNKKKENLLKVVDTEIEEKIKPVEASIEELRRYVFKNEELGQHQLALIVSSYKFRLSELCRLYISRGYITSGEFQQLQAFYEVYHGLGGNGQAEELYHKAIDLEVKD